MLRCSGAKRLEISTASSSDAHQDDGAVLRDRLARDRGGGQRRELPLDLAARRPSARRFDVVSRIAEASTSCSACASMSAAR